MALKSNTRRDLEAEITDLRRRLQEAEETIEAMRAGTADEHRRSKELIERRALQLEVLAVQLTEAEQRERRRLAKVLHDHLQQLLVAARMKVGLVQRHAANEKSCEYCRQLDELLNESVSASRSLAVELSPPVLHDGGLAAGLEWLAQQMEDKHGLLIATDFQPAVEPADKVIRVLVFEAVRELLFNTVKHAGVDRAAVQLCAASDDCLRITISDEGIGFDPLALASRQAGSGLGLYHVRERLELLGGRMEIDSRPGHGTRTIITAPLGRRAGRGSDGDEESPQSAAVAERTSPRPKAQARGPRPALIRVLLADDHPILRRGLADLLGEHADIELVGEAGDGEEAVALALRTRPDVILMDVTMPRMDGLDATRRVVAALPETRVIGLSMHEENDMAAAMRQAGAVAYLTKGGPFEVLLHTIRDFSPPSIPQNSDA